MIMPQEIRVDNYHGPLHVHPPREQGDPEPIAERSMDSVREIIWNHAQRRKTIIYAELLEELR